MCFLSGCDVSLLNFARHRRRAAPRDITRPDGLCCIAPDEREFRDAEPRALFGYVEWQTMSAAGRVTDPVFQMRFADCRRVRAVGKLFFEIHRVTRGIMELDEIQFPSLLFAGFLKGWPVMVVD